MDEKAAARELIYTNATNNKSDTDLDGKSNKHNTAHSSSKRLNNFAIVPMKLRHQKDDIVIPSITANRQRTAIEHLDIQHIQKALEIRSKFMHYCRLISDIQAILAFTSIILMIIAEEIIFQLNPTQPRNNEPIATIVLKSVIGFFSFLQLVLALIYWYFHLALVNLDNNQPQRWRLALSPARIFRMLFELIIIVVFPYPGFNRYTLNSNETHSASAYVTPDVGVSLPMFLRLYFVYCAFVLHTQIIENVGTAAIGYMNNVHFSFKFITKIFFKEYPFRTLFGLSVITFLIGSWSYRACEFDRDSGHLNYSMACWLYTVTFTTIGYGDVYPNTDGGRIVSGIVSLWGIISMAVMIAIIQQYLDMHRSERYVFEYNTLLEMNKERKYYIGNLIKFTVKAWFLRLKGNDKGHEYHQAQRKIYRAVNKIRNLRQLQRQKFPENEDNDQSNEQQMNPQFVELIQNRLNQLDAKIDYLTQLMHQQMNVNMQQNNAPITVRC